MCALVALMLGALTLPACERSASPPIILILVDTLRADYLGAYGFDGGISPNIDALASESVVFERCFSQAPWTKPSIASLFTSLQPAVHQVLTHQGRFGKRDERPTTETLSEEVVTLAEALRAAGYATGAFVANPWIRKTHGFGQGFDVYDSQATGNATRAEPVFKAARAWIEELSAARPYFAYIHLMDVHGPYNASDADYEAVRHSPEFGTEPIALTPAQIRSAPNYLRRSRWAREGANDTRVWRGRYAANVYAGDRRLGKFFDELRADRTLTKAIVVLTADHGEQLHEHGMWDHGNSLYDEELHVPLIVRLPGGRNGGRKVSEVVSLIDVMPTLVKLAGAAAVDGVQGRDLSPAFEPGGAIESVASFATAVKWKPALRSVRTERYKLIKNADRSRTELYDVEADPRETAAISNDAAALAQVDALLTAQNSRNQKRGTLAGGEAELPARVRERLRALGYDE
jgi:arylsulfatase A-like enzyme